MNSRSPNSWTKPAIRVAAAGFGVAVAGPLGGALGGWLGAALGGPAAHLVEKYAEKFGDSAAEKLLDNGADSLVDSLKESAPDLAQAYRDALRQSLADVHREVTGGFDDYRFDDWFANWDLCLAESLPLNLPPTHPDQLVPEKLDDLFLSTLKCLDAQGTAIREKSLSLSLDLKYREVPEALLSELNNRLPQRLEGNIRTILVKSEYEVSWKQTLLIFQEYVGSAVRRIDETTQKTEQNVNLLVQMAKEARLEKRVGAEQRTLRANPIPELSEHFLGREDDLKPILECVRGHRAVTVTGLGGIGKSEMARAVAQAASGEDWTAEGVFYIDLQAATDTNLVKSTLISNLGLDPDEKAIPSRLKGRRLFVLDDLFQVLVGDRKGIQEFVRDLYTSAENSHFLLTSREPLGVPGVENLCPLGRLLPPHDANLFRSVAEASGYKWQDGDAARLADFLPQLDGYPLAIMIAANRLSDVSVETLLRRWENRHTEALNLPGISPAELSKMTSVDFSLVLSFNHLPQGQVRALFALFADLPGGATDKTLEAIMGDEVDDFLAYLVRGSLVQRQEDRYGMLVPVREFASKRRTEASLMLSQKLDADLIAFAEQWCGNSAFWNTPRRREAISVLSNEKPNFFAAVGRAKARNDNSFLAKLISALGQFLAFLRDDSGEMLLDGVAAARAVQQVQLEADCLRSLGDLYRMDDGQLETAQKAYDDALSLYSSTGDKSGEASCIEGLGDVQKQKDKPEEARQRFDEAVPLYRGKGEKLGEANCLRKIAELEEGGGQQALEKFEAALALFRDVGDELGEANCLRSMAPICADLNNASKAQKLLKPALTLFKKLGDKPREGNCLMLSGRLHVMLDEYPSATKDFKEAQKAFTDMGDQVGQGFCLASFDDMRERLLEWIHACTGRAECLRGLGDVHLLLDETEEAKRCYLDALPLYHDSVDFNAGEAHCRVMLGDFVCDTNDYSGRLEDYEEARKLYAGAGDKSKEAELLEKSGEMHEHLGQHQQAWNCFEQALGFYTDNSDKLGQAKCLRGLADVHVQRHQLGDAMQKYNEALKLYEGTDPSDDLALTYWGISEAYMEGGRRDDAVRWMEKAAELYESIDEADQAQQARNRVEEWRRDMRG